MAKVLVVEDDAAIGSVLDSALRGHGHTVRWCRDGRSALRETAADLVLLDLGLPDVDGVEVCRRLRSALPGAVLVILTARADEMDVVVGLETGADDYLTKPIRLAELLARVRAHLRRGAPAAPSTPVVRIGALEVDIASRRVSLGGREVALRAREFDLLARLAVQPGQAVSRDTLMCDVWDSHWHGSTKTLDVHIAALRRKLASAAEPPHEAPRIATLRGHGYRLEGD
ncbi:response regulator transcription factor [Amycolatopsis rubida]|uniref:Response regulator transcription factor n=1 Tax=Amycolatopsis rubida TaxID=112413 RepID=A0ABX0C7N9_9PSEU|nr:response regulator transcription factor [Amycolatopsis sp. M39]MYW95938.1 response regulator [Amycolatopsis rubida]NEC60928.1 response regulator transcription factor [Amycolatopsis rubida]OAP25166.1 Transcriptional regulatory protein YycF [Amycolatopsis sp. M39]